MSVICDEPASKLSVLFFVLLTAAVSLDIRYICIQIEEAWPTLPKTVREKFSVTLQPLSEITDIVNINI
jgi:hypothetical protein